jgi:hypothetical protein
MLAANFDVEWASFVPMYRTKYIYMITFSWFQWPPRWQKRTQNMMVPLQSHQPNKINWKKRKENPN